MRKLLGADMCRIGLCSCSLVLLAACSAGSHASGGGSDWEAVLDDSQHGNALFSFGFADSPPRGTRLRLNVHFDSASRACELYSAGEDSVSGTFWYLGVETSAVDEAEYQIVPDIDHAAAGNRYASVRLVHVDHWSKSEKHVALEGSVTIVESPSGAEEWNEGARAVVKIDAAFPTSAAVSLGCEDSASGTGVSAASCRCEKSDHSVVDCTAEDGEDCCLSFAGKERKRLQAQLAADQCRAICVASSPGLLKYCSELD